MSNPSKPQELNPFAQALRGACEAKYRSVPSMHAAICRAFGEEAISLSTIHRMMAPRGYRPRGRRAFIQLKRVLPDLQIPPNP